MLGLKAFSGKLDVLVLNHAVQRWGWLLPNSTELANQHIGGPAKGWDFPFLESSVQVNYVSYVELSILFLPALIRAGGAGLSSQIIVTSSGLRTFIMLGSVK